MARTSVRGVVREGKTTDLGRIVLQRLDDASGWVTGRVLYDDGAPALGAALVDDLFETTPVKADGTFRTRLPAGEGLLVVDLNGAAAWPGARADDSPHPARSTPPQGARRGVRGRSAQRRT